MPKISGVEDGAEAGRRMAEADALPGREEQNLRPPDAGSEEITDSAEQQPPEPTRERFPR